MTDSRRARRAAWVAAMLGAAALLAGCSSTEGSDVSNAGAGADRGYSDEEMESEAAPEGGGAASDDRSFIVTGALYLTVEDPIEAADDATALVQSAGGRVDARSERVHDDDGGGFADLTLRIPANKLDATVESLRGLGTVDSFSTESRDVSAEVQDLDASISTLRASTQRIQALLIDAENIQAIITLEDELASRQAQLESLEAQQRGLSDRVALSTIELSLSTEPIVGEESSPSTFLTGLETGGSSLAAFLSGVLVATGVLLPWLGLAAIVTFIVVAAVRARRTRAARRRADAPQPGMVREPVASGDVPSDAAGAED